MYKLIPLIFILGACSTYPVAISKARPIKPERQYKFQTPDATHTAKIIIVRDGGIVGSAVSATVLFNGEKVCDIDPREKAIFYVEPKEYVLSAYFDHFLSDGTKYSTESILHDKETKGFRISVDNYVTHFDRVPASDIGE